MSLQIKALTKKFNQHVAVNELSFKVEPGQVFGLLGRNGAGKSTTIKQILGLITPTSGEILWKGKAIRESTVRIGYLPEERGLYTQNKINRQLLYFGKLEGMTKKEAENAIENWFKKLGILAYQNKIVGELSKGNQQKIQFIATLLHDPDLIILDEPFTGLDPVNVALFLKIMAEEVARKKVIIISSHQMGIIEQVCDAFCLLKNGRTEVSGSLQQIKEGYEFKNLNMALDKTLLGVLEKLEIPFKLDKNNIVIKVENDHDALEILNQVKDQNVFLTEFQLLKPTLQEIFVERVGDDG